MGSKTALMPPPQITLLPTLGGYVRLGTLHLCTCRVLSLVSRFVFMQMTLEPWYISI